MKRITYPAACVLLALSRGRSYGFDIMAGTHLPSGTVYPLLRRFEAEGLVSSKWEVLESASREGRRRRRHYELTEAGGAAQEVAAERYRAHLTLFADVASPATEGG